MDATVEHMEVCPDYVTCKCPTNHIKLTLPIYVSPSGMQVACSGCHAAVEECAPAQLSEVMEAGLPYGERSGIGTERRPKSSTRSRQRRERKVNNDYTQG